MIAYRRRAGSSPLASAVLVASLACAANPHIIKLGVDACVECRMVVTDGRFGAQVVTRTGKTLTFDSIECMNRHVATMASSDVRDVWVVDANRPGTLIRRADAETIAAGTLRPPMGTAYTVATTDHAR